MTPIVNLQSRRAFTDPRDALVITHPVIAAALMLRYELLGV